MTSSGSGVVCLPKHNVETSSMKNVWQLSRISFSSLTLYEVLSYSSGLAPLKMYGELQCDMGPYRTVHCTCLLHVRSCCRVKILYRETSLLRCRTVTRAYGTCDNTGNRLMIFPCSYSVNNIYFYQLGTHSVPGWSYSYFAIFACVCLSVRLSQSGEAWERVNGGSWHVWLFQVSCFVRLLAAKGSQAMQVLSTAEAQLSLHKHNIS